MWLERSGKSANELESLMDYAKILIMPPYRNQQIRKMQDQFIVIFHHAHEIRMVHGSELSRIIEELMEEVEDIRSSFGEAHMITIHLKRSVAQLMIVTACTNKPPTCKSAFSTY